MLGGLQEKVREVSDNSSPSKSSTGYASIHMNIAFYIYINITLMTTINVHTYNSNSLCY